MATKNICTYPMEPALAKNANAIIEQDGKLKRVNLDWEFDKKANGIVSEVDGEVIAVKDSATARAKNLILCGKSKQKTTKGNQLFNACGAQNNAFGTAEVSENGKVISVTGTYYVSFPIALTANETYYIGFEYETNNGNYGIRFEYADNSISETLTNPFVFIPEKDVISIYLYASTGEEKTVVYKDVQVCKGDTALPWEEYSGGAPSPNPDYPQDIVSVENPETYVYGKNLLKNIAKTSTSNGITFTVNDDGSVTVNGTATAGAWLNLTGKLLLPAGTYILSGCPKGGVYASTYVLSCDYVADYGNNPKTFTLDEPKTITVNIGIYSGYTANNLTFYPMIRCIECEDAAYEQFKEKQTISFTHTLHGVPVESGGNYTDADGQQWVCDEIDLERGVYIQRIQQLVYDGSEDENWYLGGGKSDGTNNRFEIAEPFGPLYRKGTFLGINGCCNAFAFKYQGGIPDTNCFRIGTNAAVTVSYILFNPDTSVVTFEDVNAWKEWLAENPITLLIPTTEPIETPLTDAEIYAFKTTEMNYPNTTILNDAGAFMKLDYFADTLKYVLKHGGGGGFSTVSKFEVTLPASGWQKASDNTYYSQVITVPGATADSKIDLQPTPAQLISLLNNGTSMFASNEAGTITVYVVGSKPTSDMTMQATKMEVVYV